MIQCILTDIEGTTSSIEFVHKVLFPYSRENFLPFLSHNPPEEVQPLIYKLWSEHLGHQDGSEPIIQDIAKLLQAWVDQDLKNKALKTIQGHVWRIGFETKAYYGHVYDDVRPALEKWKKEGLDLAVYSSGSVRAQKLLFKHSEAGDLTPLFHAYFDTDVGHKREVKSYLTIAERLHHAPAGILFLSDIVEELEAAEKAGLKTCQLLREPLPSLVGHPNAKDFYEVDGLIKHL